MFLLELILGVIYVVLVLQAGRMGSLGLPPRFQRKVWEVMQFITGLDSLLEALRG
jgi:hypothetical protein